MVLDQQVVIQVPGVIDDGYGGTIPGGWESLPAEWASVEPLRGQEAVANLQVTSRQTYRLWMRAHVEVRTSYRLLWEGRILNIREAPPPLRKPYRQLVVEDMGDAET